MQKPKGWLLVAANRIVFSLTSPRWAVLLGGEALIGRRSTAMRAGIDLSRLHGRVREVSIGADYKVRVVSIGEDMRVRLVPMAAHRPGQWEMVTIGEHFSVEFVTIGEDFTIRYVTIGEGVR
jgi:hypothetical protein